MTAPDLTAAAAAIDAAHGVVDAATRRLAETGGPDANQVLAYDLAHAAAAVETGRAMLDYGAKGDARGPDHLRLRRRRRRPSWLPKLFGREAEWGVEPGALDGTRGFVAAYRAPEFLAALADTAGPRHLDGDFEMVQDTFRRFADEKIAPIAEHIHRDNADIPEDDHRRPGRDGGVRPVGPRGVRTATPRAARASTSAWSSPPRSCPEASLGAGGSLITRPEILTRALLAGGTEEQKQRVAARSWPPPRS